MIRALIVENEPAVAQHLVELLNRNFNDIELVGVYDTVNTSLEGIKKFQPQLVFMDVELHAPETGFDILQKLAHIDFKVIFTTAYNKYAIQAIKFSALDYLLKPINEDELKLAIRKFIAERSVTSNLQRDSLLSYQEGYQDARIGLPGANSYALIPVREIIYCRGESSQSSIFMTGRSMCVGVIHVFLISHSQLSFTLCSHHFIDHLRRNTLVTELDQGVRTHIE